MLARLRRRTRSRRPADPGTLVAERIPLEVCITSNVCTGAVASLDVHPVRQLFDQGVIITLNTDDPGLFRCDLRSEFQLAKDRFGFSDAELRQLEQNAWDYRFTSVST